MTLDPRLPGFERLWDVSHAQQVLTRVFPPRPGWQVETVAIDRIRHRLGRRGIVHYQVTYRHGILKTVVHIAGGAWFERDLGAARDKISRRSQVEPPPPLDSVVEFDTPTSMLFLVFPVDRRLPGLHLLGSVPGRRLLGSLTGISLENGLSHKIVRHRLGLGATVRVTGEGSHTYLKFRPRNEARRAALLNGVVADRVPSSIRCARQRLISGDFEITATHHMQGRSLDAILRDSPQDGAAEIGTALAELHSVDGDDMPDRGAVPQDRARRATAWLTAALPEATTLIHELGASTQNVVSGSSLVHGDLKPEHVFDCGETIGLIDTDSAGRGNPLSDLATLTTRLPESVARWLLTNYEASATGLAWSGFGSEWALASLKFALSHAQRQAPGWRVVTTSTLERGLHAPM